jgi:SAM-dependent methyltransferase
MGRFASTVEFYSRYREPYPPEFFRAVAERLGLRGTEKLLDVGCGPGLLAIGFGPFVARATGLDPEPAMIEAAKTAAASAGLALSLVQGRVEEFSRAESFDLVTIGRALHWLDRDATLAVLEHIVPASGRILICGASSSESALSLWTEAYEHVRRSWAAEGPGEHERRYRIDGKTWFAGSCFGEAGMVSVTERRQLTVEALVGRALSKSNTSPTRLGERRAQFEEEIAAVLEPFAQDGVLNEEIVARASIFARLPGRSR